MTTIDAGLDRETRLSQIIAIEKGTKSAAQRSFTDSYRLLQRVAQLTGISRAYRPVADDGEDLPGESTRVQVRVDQVLAEVAKVLTRAFDVTLTKDLANQAARADVVVDGVILAPAVPVTFLLTFEKTLVDLQTFVTNLPVLDVAEEWTYDPNAEAYATSPARTARTKKVPRNHVKAPATDKHPAQVETYFEDVVVGHWSTIKFSGAVPAARRTELLDRLAKLTTAVKFARERANLIPVIDRKIGDEVFGYLFA